MRATAIGFGTYAPYRTPERVEAALGATKVVGIAIAAPFIGLAFVIAAPLVGLGALAWFAARALAANSNAALRFAKNVALFLAAPFIGLAYALAAPFVGIGAVVWIAVKAVRERRT